MLASRQSMPIAHLISRRHKVNVHNNNIVTGVTVDASGGGSGGGICDIG